MRTKSDCEAERACSNPLTCKKELETSTKGANRCEWGAAGRSARELGASKHAANESAEQGFLGSMVVPTPGGISRWDAIYSGRQSGAGGSKFWNFDLKRQRVSRCGASGYTLETMEL